MVTHENVKERWENYFCELFYDGQGSNINVERLETKEGERNLDYYHRIRIDQVKEALKRMNKAIRVKLLVPIIFSFS